MSGGSVMLRPAPGGLWKGAADGGAVYLVCAGDHAGPDEALHAALCTLLGRLDEVRRAVRDYAVGLDPEASIPLEGRPGEALRAGDCGLHGTLVVLGLEARERSAPARVIVVCHTGEPDGHVDLAVVVEEGRPTAMSARV